MGSPPDLENASVEAGFIAQEVLNTDLSFAVVTPEDPETEPYGLNYNSLFTVAVAAIKELDSKVTALEAKLA